MVAPSRVRGLKPQDQFDGFKLKFVAPSRVRGLKPSLSDTKFPEESRTLTGAWIETILDTSPTRMTCVAPSRVRGLKRFHPEPLPRF